MQLIELETTAMTPPTYRKILMVSIAVARVYMSSFRILFCVSCYVIGNQLKVIGIQIERKDIFRVGYLQLENAQRQYTSGSSLHKNKINFINKCIELLRI